MSEQTVRLHVQQDAVDPSEHALNELRKVLEDGAAVDGPDDEGVVEVTVDADNHEAAIKVVIDAIAEAGADDHFEFADRP